MGPQHLIADLSQCSREIKHPSPQFKEEEDELQRCSD